MHNNMIQARGRAQKDITERVQKQNCSNWNWEKTDLLISFYRLWLAGLQGHIFGMEQESTALPVFYRTMLGTSLFFRATRMYSTNTGSAIKESKGGGSNSAEQPSMWRVDRGGLELSDSGNHSQHWWLGLSPLLQTNTDHWFPQRGCGGWRAAV